MKSNIFFLVVLAIIFSATSLYAQQSVVFSGEKFTGVKSSSGVDIYLIPSDEYKIAVDTGVINPEKVRVNVSKGVAVISVEGHKKNGKIYVYSPEIKSIHVSGAVDVYSDGTLRGSSLKIVNSGASDVKISVDYKNVKVKSEGASDVVLNGNADSLYINVSGASDLSAFDLTNIYAKVKARGASDVKLNTDSTITADIAGASSIKYKKEPAHKNIVASGASSSGSPKTTWVEAQGNNGNFSVEENEDTVRIKFNNNELIVIDDGQNTRVLKRKIEHPVRRHLRFRGNWAGLEFGVNGYLSPGFSLDIPTEYSFLELNYAKSVSFSLNFFQQSINLIHNHFGIVTGMGVQWYNYKFYNKNTVLVPDSGKIYGYYDQTAGRSYVKSKLTSSYLVVPLILEYQTNRKHGGNSFHISAGVVGGVRLASHSKQVFNFNGDDKNKPKIHDEFYLQPFKADLTFRIGWGPINLFANYALTEMFRKNRGPELYPFNVGFVLPFG